MGHSFKGGSQTFRCLSDNLTALKLSFPFKDGYFGSKGIGAASSIRNIQSENPLDQASKFYDTAAYGGIEERLVNAKGFKTTMEDGTVFTFRQTSTSDGSPAVDINIRKSTDTGGVKKQKIHFTQKGN